ncbi:BsuPI-related putative proteinase inhibitor [Salirhabdus salicampi]|uniref:BsuPI-related putative proteinase inhibitor n=1 Tax=Salirhabdus salicampi TaxID=476102 RepID=UPI0020C2B2B4|nr:BsuPI-related putative proteinase inhibitor [Salirhabdus salicampi]MCP8615552.1 BsuPI-related putative proteinase inhibitor [Salirhabdus salicampi]
MVKRIIFPVAFSLVMLVSCGQSSGSNAEDELQGSNGGGDSIGQKKDGQQVDITSLLEELELTVNTEKTADSVTFQLTLTNSGNQDVELTFSSGQQYEIVVENEQGAEVYKYSHGKAFTEALINKQIGAGESETWEETWNLKDNEGNKVEAGNYTVLVTLLPAQLNQQVIEGTPFVQNVNITLP